MLSAVGHGSSAAGPRACQHSGAAGTVGHGSREQAGGTIPSSGESPCAEHRLRILLATVGPPFPVRGKSGQLRPYVRPVRGHSVDCRWPSWVFAHVIAVGTRVTPRPPHRSGRAQFRHPAPTSGVWRQTARWATDEGFSVSEGSPRPASLSAPTRCRPSGFVAGAIAARAR